MSNRAHANGFSMIEVLIAVLILAVGLLGVAALQLSSLNSGQEGYFRSQATAIAEDFASRVRVNRDIARMATPPWGLPAWNPPAPDVADPMGAMQTYLNTYYAGAPFVCAAPPAQICRANDGAPSAVCTEPQQVAFDVFEPCNQAATLLPVGRLWSRVVGTRLIVAVSWQVSEPREDTGEELIVNSLCRVEFAAMAQNEDCVLMEVVP